MPQYRLVFKRINNINNVHRERRANGSFQCPPTKDSRLVFLDVTITREIVMFQGDEHSLREREDRKRR